MTDKIYGASVLPQDNEPINDEKMESDYTDVEVASARDELKQSYDGSVIEEKITTDAISGTVVSEVEDGTNEIMDFAERNDIRGKNISPAAISFVESVTGVDISDKGPAIAEYFETLDDSNRKTMFDGEDIGKLSELLGDDVIASINNTTNNDPEDTDAVIRRLYTQIYSSYKKSVDEVDDLKEITSIIHNYKKYTTKYNESLKKDENGKPLPMDEQDSLETTLEAMNSVQEWGTKYLEEQKRIDARNKRLKPDYSIDDLNPIKEALEDALNLVTLNKYISVNYPLMKKEYANKNDRVTVIKNWITDIKNDPTTYYTLPTNDFNNISVTISETENFIYNALLTERCVEFEMPSEYLDKYTPLETIALNEKWLTEEEIETIKDKAEMLLYVIAKTFKSKKLQNETTRHILSYTLDMLGKLARKNYRNKFYEFSGTCYECLRK